MQKIDRTNKPLQNPKRYTHVPQKSVFMNSYLIQGGGLMSKNEDFTLIKEVDNFILHFQNNPVNT
jgi:hypothetical protein